MLGSENILNYEKTISTFGVKEITVREAALYGIDHKAVLEVFVKHHAKLRDVFV